MSPRLLLSAAFVLILAAPALAQPSLDAEPSGPCLWRIVVKTEPHPLLTASFRDQLHRDLIAALQPAIGPLGTVDVIDLEEALAGKADSLVQDFGTKGFAALDSARDLSGVKTHFLRVEVRDGQYHLESRQHDGFAGLASPVVRKQSTRSPELVGRAAGLMIDRDFGLTGTLEQPYQPNATEVTVRFRGGKLMQPGQMERFVKVGDVFSISQVTKAANRPAPPPARTATGKIIAPPPGSIPPAALTPKVHSFTLLKVTAVQPDGSAKCAVIRSPIYTSTLPNVPALMGYRCMKLSTIQAPVSVRLVNGSDTAKTSTSNVNVRANEIGFSAKGDVKDFFDFRDGLYRSPRPLSNIACITVTLDKAVHYPVPVLGPEPITLLFDQSPESEAKAIFERSAIAVSTRAADARIAQVAAFDGVGKLIAARKNSEALARARAAFESADASDKVLTEELEELKKKADLLPGAANLFAAVDRQLTALRASNSQLAASIKELEKFEEKAKDPAVLGAELLAQSLQTRINLLLAGGEVEQALLAYTELANLQPNDPNIKARRDKLAAEWKPKDAEHEKQRDYMLKTWPAIATIGDLKDSLGQLRAAIDACKKAGDRHACRRLLGILGGFPSKLGDLIKDLDPNSEADRKNIVEAKNIRDAVGKFEQEIVDYLKKE